MNLLSSIFFSEDDLQPTGSGSDFPQNLLSKEILSRLEQLAREFQDKGVLTLSKEEVSRNTGIAMFVSFLKLFGVVEVTCEKEVIICRSTGYLAGDFPYVIFLLLKHGFSIFRDWERRYKPIPNRICALEFLHHIELERIEQSKAHGFAPEVIHTIPVSFALIKARSQKRKEDVFLFEINKDWRLYNLVGGKQKPEDAGNYETTILREIEEELGIPRSRVTLVPLTRQPLKGYGLTGNRGTLSYYPCMLYWVRIRGHFKVTERHCWLTEGEILRLWKEEKNTQRGLMVNPVYLDFIFNKLPGGLKGLDYSLDEPIDSFEWYFAVANFIKKNANWFISLLMAILEALLKRCSS